MMYDIVRFKQGKRSQLILEGITEEQAKAWCNNEYTRKDGQYFDGFTATGKFPTQKPKYTHYFVPTELV